MTDELDRFSGEIVELFPALMRWFARFSSDDLTKGKISIPQMLVLELVSKQTKVAMKALAEALSIKTSSATVLIDRMVKERMVRRARDEKDRRIVWVTITAKGKKCLAGIISKKKQAIRSVYGCLSVSERMQYLGILRKVHHCMKQGTQ